MLWNQEKQVFDFLVEVMFFVASVLHLLSRCKVKISFDRNVYNIKKMWVSFLKKDVASNGSYLVSHNLSNIFAKWNNHVYLVTQASFW